MFCFTSAAAITKLLEVRLNGMHLWKEQKKIRKGARNEDTKNHTHFSFKKYFQLDNSLFGAGLAQAV
jgi:hypothetical protein